MPTLCVASTLMTTGMQLQDDDWRHIYYGLLASIRRPGPLHCNDSDETWKKKLDMTNCTCTTRTTRNRGVVRVWNNEKTTALQQCQIRSQDVGWAGDDDPWSVDDQRRRSARHVLRKRWSALWLIVNPYRSGNQLELPSWEPLQQNPTGTSRSTLVLRSLEVPQPHLVATLTVK